ncbi:Roadblock/LC7 family protein (modular protein) [Desulfosarcina cetonica]|uniref:roadblock/LC7 domain-containing protein n=1 Tax=Desulfosarcina cetonica TaxID=90730 RepID=UPI0009F89422|nr:roadblock/LC7 domain-containing protein [Desulfosarcina cetonica]VTR65525.1 Roadblock/LC7 family protein (modular protein) [Desulfosarcina cetonica]
MDLNILLVTYGLDNVSVFAVLTGGREKPDSARREKTLSYILDQEQLDGLEEALTTDLMTLGLQSVILIDMAGNVIVNLDDGKVRHDVYSLAALAAGNFGAVSAMASIIGEEEFSLLFHKGKSENINFTKIMDDFLLVSIFGNDVSLGYLRLKIDEVIKKIKALIERTRTS